LVGHSDLDSPSPLPPADIAADRRDGFVHLQAVLEPDTLQHLGAAITRLTQGLNTQRRASGTVLPGQPIDMRKNPLIWAASAAGERIAAPL
jgi:hypothetical protein